MALPRAQAPLDGHCPAATADPANAARQAASAAQGVADAAEKLRVLMLLPDEAQLGALVSDALSYGHSNGRVDTKAHFMGDLLSRRSHFTSIDISAQTIVVTGDTAVLRHSLHANTLDGGQPGTVDLFVLQVWHHTLTGWQLLARQAVRQSSPA